MTKEQQQAFNTAYKAILDSDKRIFVRVNPASNREEVCVPLEVVIKEMTKFIKSINNDLGLTPDNKEKK